MTAAVVLATEVRDIHDGRRDFRLLVAAIGGELDACLSRFQATPAGFTSPLVGVVLTTHAGLVCAISCALFMRSLVRSSAIDACSSVPMCAPCPGTFRSGYEVRVTHTSRLRHGISEPLVSDAETDWVFVDVESKPISGLVAIPASGR